jgi:hypothetical protein
MESRLRESGGMFRQRLAFTQPEDFDLLLQLPEASVSGDVPIEARRGLRASDHSGSGLFIPPMVANCDLKIYKYM